MNIIPWLSRCLDNSYRYLRVMSDDAKGMSPPILLSIQWRLRDKTRAELRIRFRKWFLQLPGAECVDSQRGHSPQRSNPIKRRHVVTNDDYHSENGDGKAIKSALIALPWMITTDAGKILLSLVGRYNIHNNIWFSNDLRFLRAWSCAPKRLVKVNPLLW